MCCRVRLCPPVQVCAPHNPAGRCRRPQLERSPWRGLPAELSSCTPGKAWLSSQTGVSGPCSKNRKRENTEKGINSVFLFSHNLGSLSEVCFFANSSDIAKIRTNERGKPHSHHFILLRFFFSHCLKLWSPASWPDFDCKKTCVLTCSLWLDKVNPWHHALECIYSHSKFLFNGCLIDTNHLDYPVNFALLVVQCTTYNKILK